MSYKRIEEETNGVNTNATTGYSHGLSASAAATTTTATTTTTGAGNCKENGTNGNGNGNGNGSGSHGVKLRDFETKRATCFPWALYPYTESTGGFNQEIKDFVQWVSPTIEERKMREDLVSRINSVVQELWQQARVEVIGSFKTELCIPTSDVDLVIFGVSKEATDLQPLFLLSNALEEHKLARGKAKVITTAKVPIIKFKDFKSACSVDIAFEITTGFENTKIVEGFLNEFPLLRPLTLIIKYFLKQWGINDTWSGGIGSYTLVILITSYLQKESKLKGKTTDETESLADLLLGFFEFYGKKFDYAEQVISVKDGCYYNKKTKRWYNEQNPGLLSVEDPLFPEIDVGCASFQIGYAKQIFAITFHHLSNCIQQEQQEDRLLQQQPQQQQQPQPQRQQSQQTQPEHPAAVRLPEKAKELISQPLPLPDPTQDPSQSLDHPVPPSQDALYSNPSTNGNQCLYYLRYSYLSVVLQPSFTNYVLQLRSRLSFIYGDESTHFSNRKNAFKKPHQHSASKFHKNRKYAGKNTFDDNKNQYEHKQSNSNHPTANNTAPNTTTNFHSGRKLDMNDFPSLSVVKPPHGLPRRTTLALMRDKSHYNLPKSDSDWLFNNQKKVRWPTNGHN